jgi:hypothetical protein
MEALQLGETVEVRIIVVAYVLVVASVVEGMVSAVA